MPKKPHLPVVLLGLAAAGVAATSDRLYSPETAPLDELSFSVEANVADEHGEVILHAETGQPIQRVALIAPDGRVIQMIDSSKGTIGLSELTLESGEPGLEDLFAAYPEGTYVVRALTLGGTLCAGTVELDHALPFRWSITAPAPAALVARDVLDVEWTHDPTVDHYTLDVIEEEDDTRLSATPLPGATHFRVPASLLRPDTEYQLVLTAYTASGNRVVRERHFRTQP